MKPVDASLKKNEEKLKNLYLEKYLTYEPDNGRIFKINDKVRLYSKKTIFTKGSKANFTDEVFTVSKVFPSKPITYEICDNKGNIIEGKIYSYELVKSKIN